ncbi:hypothetical protein SIN8267_02957 [Sinobacterium norvegicum]|uniref:Esterase YqiA n=1 Tax=Sinobacterium norvegicum TaxID=1641715 RepID=A0ABM9AJ60_9GAMM|nr:YqiA/YcfP family alpha/beta fold hydrolase [Sinobacterium norvegicum]CAH0992820.1 hypothetical protein SIN8267_02957 [Sinobacterium norvegicum]
MNPPKKQLLYIHGFQSSAQSLKATETADYLRKHRPDIDCIVPNLPDYPRPAIEMLEQLIASCDGEVGLIGSSLGGFYATYLSQRLGLKAVLINPAVTPHLLIRGYLGRNKNPYTDNIFTLTASHIDDFEAMLVEPLPRPDDLLVMVQQGDETLDYRLAEAKYNDCRLVIEAGGNHRFVGYDEKMVQIIRFLQL